MSNNRTELRELAAATAAARNTQPTHELITPLQSFRRRRRYSLLRIDVNANGDDLIERDIFRGRKRTRRDLSFDFDEEEQVSKRMKTIDSE